jgi:hydrogenase expression/formation protein HypE
MNLLDAGIDVHCLRDLTRGGPASALCEIASTRGVHIHVEQAAVPINEDVQGACEILGLDPMYVANEGRFVAFVAPQDARRALSILGTSARQIGTVCQDNGNNSLVTLESAIGATRILDMLNGDQLPRIC